MPDRIEPPFVSRCSRRRGRRWHRRRRGWGPAAPRRLQLRPRYQPGCNEVDRLTATASPPPRRKGGRSSSASRPRSRASTPPRPLRRDRGALRPDRLRPAHHHRQRRQRPALPGPGQSRPTRTTRCGPYGVRPGRPVPRRHPCDAAAIAGSLEHFKAPASASPSPVWPKPTPSPPSGDTVTVTLKQPWVPFPAYLAGGIGGQPWLHHRPVHDRQPQRVGAARRHRAIRFKEWVAQRPLHRDAQPRLLAHRSALPGLGSPTAPSSTPSTGQRPRSRQHRHHAHRPARGDPAVQRQRHLQLPRRHRSTSWANPT